MSIIWELQQLYRNNDEFYLELSPEDAKNILEHTGKGYNIRQISPSRRDEYLQKMENNRWDPLPMAAILLDENGKITNGQHRLDACARQSKRIKFRFARSSDKRLEDIDNTYVRLSHQRLRANKRTISIVRSISNTGAVIGKQKARGVTDEEKKRYLEAYRDSLDWVDNHIKISNKPIHKAGFASVICRAFENGVDKGLLEAFCKQCHNLLSIDCGEPIGHNVNEIMTRERCLLSQKLRDRLGAIENCGIQGQQEEINLTENALEKFLSNSKTNILRSTSMKKTHWPDILKKQ
jgi:hypothetical protein